MGCTGKSCSQVSYEFVSFNPPLTFEYTPPGGGKTSSGELDSANQNYINMWLGAFFVWMGFGLMPGFSPFRTTRIGCDTGCDCDLGPETITTKQYTYTPPVFRLPQGGRIKISGKFTLRVKSRAGVCTPRAGTEFSVGKSDINHFLAMLPVSADATSVPVVKSTVAKTQKVADKPQQRQVVTRKKK